MPVSDKVPAFLKPAIPFAPHILAFFFGLLIGWFAWHHSGSALTNPNAIHRYVVGNDGFSLDDKINAAAALNKPKGASPLTGSRDIPVFFQDFNSELVEGEDGNMVAPVVETLSGSKNAIDDIERKMMLA
jgi:hypothetical protein